MTCQGYQHPRVSRGVRGKGTETFTTQGTTRPCPNPAKPGEAFCGVHKAQAERMQVKLAAKRVREANRKAK